MLKMTLKHLIGCDEVGSFDKVQSLNWDPNANRIAFAGYYGAILLFDDKLQFQGCVGFGSSRNYSFTWHPNKTYISVILRSVHIKHLPMYIILFDLETNELLLDKEVSTISPYFISFSPDGLKLLYSDSNSYFNISSVHKFGDTISIPIDIELVLGAEWSHDSQYIALCGIYDQFRLWSVGQNDFIRDFSPTYNSKPGEKMFNPKRNIILWQSSKNILELWDIGNLRTAAVLKTSAELVKFTWSNDGNQVFALDQEQNFYRWSLEYPADESTLYELKKYHAVTFRLCATSEEIVCCGSDKKLWLWDYQNQDFKLISADIDFELGSLRMSHVTKDIAGMDTEGNLILLHEDNGVWAQYRQNKIPENINVIAWSHDSSAIFMGLENGDIKLASLKPSLSITESALRNIELTPEHIAVSDKNYLAVSTSQAIGKPKKLYMYDDNQNLVFERDIENIESLRWKDGASESLLGIQRFPHVIFSVNVKENKIENKVFEDFYPGAWSPSGKLIASIGHRDFIQIRTNSFTPQEEEKIYPYDFGEDMVREVAISYDELFVALGLDNGSIYIFDLVTMQSVVKQKLFDTPVFKLAWSPINNLLAVSSEDGLFIIYELTNFSVVFRQQIPHPAQQIEWSPDGQQIAVFCYPQWVFIWEIS